MSKRFRMVAYIAPLVEPWVWGSISSARLKRRGRQASALLLRLPWCGWAGRRAKAFGLSVEPPDLTTLKARNGGVFPRERLLCIIDGREDIKVHVEREMPVWGQWFKMEAEDGLGGAEGDEATVRKRVESLIDFIESLQR